jgi:flagellar biosynthesis/type III secretory pathway M-ring protein FliF/YscJ
MKVLIIIGSILLFISFLLFFAFYLSTSDFIVLYTKLIGKF